MRALLFRSLGVCLCLALAGGLTLAQEDESRALIDKAIKAHGGEKALAKTKAGESKGKGTIHLMGGIEFTADNYAQMPDKFKSVMRLTVMNMNITVTQGFDGKKLWIQVNDKTMDLDDKLVDTVKEALYAEHLATLVPLKDKGVKLSPLGETKVEGRAAVGVQASSKGHKDVNLFFDKTTNMLLKLELRTVDPMSGQEVTQEKIYLEYKDVDGAKTPSKLLVHQDGKKFLEMEISDIKVVDRLDDSIFAKP